MEQQCKEFSYKEVGALLASDARTSECFGSSIAISGNRLVVGAAHETTAGPDAGKVYIYNWDTSTSTYAEVATILASDAHAGDQFGNSVAISGNRLVVGAQRQDTAGPDAGKVYIYGRNGAAYIEVAQLTASDEHTRNWFGSSVAISGDRLVVGAHGDDNAGKIYIYDWDISTSTYVEVATITASDAAAYDYFGNAVALSGNSKRLVVGALYEDTVGVDAGKVYIYDWNGSAYVEVSTITASDAAASDIFGSAIALSGNRLVVGAHYDDTVEYAAGKVYVYEWNSDTSVYDEVTTITASDAAANDYFGSSVALTSVGNRLLVGACGVDTAGIDGGKVYIYERNGTE